MAGVTDAFTIDPATMGFVGQDLHRPECVLATRRGELFVSDRRGGVTRIAPDGTQVLLGARDGLVPNGLAMEPDRSFLLANLHDPGGVWRLDPAGQLRPVLMEADGIALRAVNFVRLDGAGRIWITANPPVDGDRYPTEAPRGFIVLLDGRGARVVADGIGWANECLIDPDGRYLYVNETFGRRLSRYRIGADGSLSDRTCVAAFGAGMFPDGLALDADGAFWVVSVASNRVTRVMPDGAQHHVLEDADTGHLARMDDARTRHALRRSELTGRPGRVLRNITSIAFGGPDRRSAFLGSIGGDRLATFRAPVAGIAPVHWDW